MNDEGTHVTGGWLLYKGRIPYKEFALLQYLPGTSLIAASSYALLGPELSSARLFLAAAMLLTTFMTFYLARKLYGEEEAIAASFAFVLLAPAFGSLIFLPEPLMAPLVLLLFICLYHFDKEGEAKWLFSSGIVCGILVLLKIPGLALLLVSLAFIIARFFLTKGKPVRVLLECGEILFGFSIPLILVLAWLSSLGALGDAYIQVVVQILFKTNERLLSDPFDLAINLIILVIPAAYIWVAREDLRKGKRASLLLLLLALGAMYAVVVRFQPNRVFHALPLLSIMGGTLFVKYLDKSQRRFICGFGVLFALALLTALWVASTRGTDLDNIRGFVLLRTTPSDTILITPYGHINYLLLKREPGYRYLGLGPWGQPDDVEPNAVLDLGQRKPKIVIYSKLPQWGKNFSEYEPLIDKYIWEHYKVESETEGLYFMVPK